MIKLHEIFKMAKMTYRDGMLTGGVAGVEVDRSDGKYSLSQL